MSEFKLYKRKNSTELRPYIEGEILDAKIAINKVDLKAGSPKVGDMIARNIKNYNDQWLVSKAYFEENFEPIN